MVYKYFQQTRLFSSLCLWFSLLPVNFYFDMTLFIFLFLFFCLYFWDHIQMLFTQTNVTKLFPLSKLPLILQLRVLGLSLGFYLSCFLDEGRKCNFVFPNTVVVTVPFPTVGA